MFREMEEKLMSVCKEFPRVEKILGENIIMDLTSCIFSLGRIVFFADNLIQIMGKPKIICEDKTIEIDEFEIEGMYFIRDESFMELLIQYSKLAPLELYFSGFENKKYEIGASTSSGCCGVRFRVSGTELDEMLLKL